MKTIVKTVFFSLSIFFQGDMLPGQQNETESFKKISFESLDSINITADLYWKHDDKKTPFIVLCHQAGWSRGEYREIAPKLNKMGFNCMAIDQRSGSVINDVENETAKAAVAKDRTTSFVDAEADIIAALKYARENYAEGKLVAWGSSYSAALVIRIAGEQADLVDGVLSFAPGEYFAGLGKSKTWITDSARNIDDPVFITSAKNEFPRWKAIFDAIPGENKRKFVPTTDGNHGSRALWVKFEDSGDYWKAVTSFLSKLK
ncbi:lysophospholipase [Vicingaceae bacterium]|nr:lysophospholipase [Vicingaceae bacterium]